MKNIYLAIICALFIQASVYSQSCLPEGILFHTQSQIDNFQTNYPGCSEIEGDVIFSGSPYELDTIKNLNGLSVLTSIGGNLEIQGCQSLNSLQGLGNLQFIGGALFLDWNAFSNLEGLQNLEIITGDFSVGESENLDNLIGLENLQTIGGSVNFGYETMGGTACTHLTSLTGLENLNSIGGDLNFHCNVQLEDLSGLSGLTHIGGDLNFHCNEQLEDLSGLSGLTHIGGDLRIRNTVVLQNLAGLENIESGSISNLTITNNSLLSNCEVNSICQYLASPNGTIQIYNNAPGCNSQQEVEDACEAVNVNDIKFKNQIVIFPNPATNEIFIENNISVKITNVNIYNNIGQVVLQEKLLSDKIDISTLNRGLYFIEMVSNEMRIRKKLIVN